MENMQKQFYLIELDCSKSYKTFCELVNYSSANNICWYQESGFSYYLNAGLLVYSCNKEKYLDFETMLKNHNISFTRLDFLKDSYLCYLETINGKLSEGSFIPLENQNLIVEEAIPKITEGANGSIILNEHQIELKDTIKIYIESKEQCRHNIPHAHVDYNKQHNVFSISLVDFRILCGNNSGAKGKKAVEMLKNNIDKARRIWNDKSDSHSKFDVDQNGNILTTYHFVLNK